VQWFDREAEDGARATLVARQMPLNLRMRYRRSELRTNVELVNNWNAIPGDARAMNNNERYQKKHKQLIATG
jgi:hypothetical protein